MAAIENIPVEIEEAAANLGCGAWSRFRKVLLPLSLQGLISGTILCFAVSVSVVVTPALLGGRRGRMVGNEIYDQVLTGLNRSEEHTSELQSLMRISYAVFCLKKKKHKHNHMINRQQQ